MDLESNKPIIRETLYTIFKILKVNKNCICNLVFSMLKSFNKFHEIHMYIYKENKIIYHKFILKALKLNIIILNMI